MWPPSLSIWWRYPSMVLSLCKTPEVAAWFAQSQGIAWVKPDSVSTPTRAYWEPLLSRRKQIIINLPISYQGVRQWTAPPPYSGSCLEHCLEHTHTHTQTKKKNTGHAVSTLTKSLSIKGHLVSLAIHSPAQAPRVHTSHGMHRVISCILWRVTWHGS